MPCNASRVLRYFAKRTPDVILLNLDVHTLDIISALDKAKGETKIPTLFLLAPELLSTLANRNLSLKSRHSDYVIKPERNLMRNIRFLLPQIEEKIWFLSHAPTQLSRAKPTAASPIVEQDPVPIRPSALPSIPEPQTMPKPPRGTVSSKNQKKIGRYWHFNGGNQRLDERFIRLAQNLPRHRCRSAYAIKLYQSLCRPVGHIVQHRCFRSHRSSTGTPRAGHYRLWRQAS